MTSPLTLLLPAVLGAPILWGPAVPLRPASSASTPGAPALARPQDEARAALDKQLAWELEGLAERCQQAKAFVERNATYELLLRFDPEHAKARKTLGHKKDRKSGEWTVPERSRPPKAAEEEIAAPLRAERETLLRGHVDAVLVLLDGQELPVRILRREEQRLLELMPDHEGLRERTGEVREGDSWVLRETVHARLTRKAHEKLRGDLKGAAPDPAEAAIEAAEQTWGVTFSKALATPAVRVVSAVSDGEASETAKRAHATYAYLDQLLGTTDTLAQGTLYLFEGPAATAAFCQAYPGLEEATRKLFGGLLCSYLDHHHANASSAKREERLDGAVRMSIARHLAWTTGTWSKHGWIAEGFGIYITHQMTGTRLIYTVRESEGSSSKGGDKVEDRMKRKDADWLALARTTLQGKDAPKLAFTLGRDVNTLTRGDVLVANALAAYLLEGCEPGTALRVLKRIGRDEVGSAKALEEELGLDPPALERRLIRWLEELGK
ncbi:MAG: hypothetical protein ISQ08_08900 [Planctomycetes bacterium]|nr:hypothetical protein [Planctomycetota bacterium]MDA0948771.1 hypothetical protein [Planctomycetota bacterium]